MGKIMVTLAMLLAVPAAAAAQDFGVEWLDRVTHERMQERGPLKPQPVEWTTSGGVLAYLDNNVFLADKDGKTPGDLVVVPFVRARMDYTEQRFEASADLLLNYMGYVDLNHDPAVDLHSTRAYEQRFYGHARYVDARFTIGLDEIVRHESDPVNVLFLNRAERVVSDTLIHATYDLTRSVAAEFHGDYQVVRFEEQPFASSANNDNWRADLGLVYRQANGYDWLVQAGLMSIYYLRSQSGGAPPDSEGYYIRGGFRGDLSERFSLEALVGWITLDSDRYIGTQVKEEHSTADISVAVRFQVTETTRLFGDYNRTVGFAGGNDPFQTVNRFAAIGEWDCTEELTVRARVQWDHAASVLGVVREYKSGSISAVWKFSDHIAADAGATYRTGDTHGKVAASSEFENAVLHLGVILTN